MLIQVPKQKFGLTHYHTMPHFDALMRYSSGKHCEKRRNCLQQATSPFLTMFSTLYRTYFSFYIYFKMLSAIRFNLDQSKILSSGYGLIIYKTILDFNDLRKAIFSKRHKQTSRQTCRAKTTMVLIY